MRVPRPFVLLAAASFALSCSLFAQTESATLSGHVTDPSGAALVGAQVQVVNLETNVAQSTQTNNAGLYLFSSLQPGQYRMSVKSPGFKESVKQAVVLHVQDTLAQNFKMEIGSTSESITVAGGAPLLQTESAAVGTVVDRQFVANMPLNGRSFQSLISLTPGVVVVNAANNSPGQFSINGQRADANYFTIDGVSANVGINPTGSPGSGSSGTAVQTSASGGYNNLVSVDALQEFKIQTSTFAPEYGRLPGGQISMVTRGGTNTFHGSAFDYLRNNALDANNWFANRTGAARAPFRQNDFGGVFGGPIWKNKLFFFGSYEGLRASTPLFTTVTVPSAFVRTSPTTLAAIKPFLNTWPQPTVTPCPHTVPAPTTCDQNFASWAGGYLDSSTLNATSVRLDYNPNSKMTFFIRGTYAPSTVVQHTATVQSVQNATITVKTLTAGNVFAFSPTITNDVRFNYSWVRAANIGSLDAIGGAVPITPASDAASFAILFPVSKFGPDTSAGIFTIDSGSNFVGVIANNVNEQYNLVDSVSMVRANHQMKFGVDYRRLLPVVAASAFQNQYSFSSGSAASGFNDPWVNGIVTTYTTVVQPVKPVLYNNLGLYAQDTWKVLPRLTLTYGVRWDVNPPPSTPSSATPLFSLNAIDPANLAATTVIFGKPLYPTQWNALAPRIGLAYQLSQDARWGTVLRGGFGLFFDTAGDISNALRQAGSATNTLTSGVTFPATAAQSAPATAVLAAPFIGVQNTARPDLRLPYTYEMNVAVQQSLGQNQTLTMTYVGAIARNLLRPEAFPPNTALPQGYAVVGGTGTSDYHALQMLFQRRLSHGLQTMATYTWSHALDDGSGAQSNAIPALALFSTLGSPNFHGPADFDIKHSFQAAVSYDLPSPSVNPWVRTLAGGWGTDFIFRARTAPPVNVTDSRVFFSPPRVGNTGIRINVRPDVIAGQPLYLYGADCIAAYGPTAPAGRRLLAAGQPCPGGRGFNYNAFGDPRNTGGASTVQGTLGRNALRGFGWNQLDFTLRRDFHLAESWHLQFRSDFFNLFNHPAFGPPAADFGSGATFGLSGQALNSSLGTGGSQGGYNPLYQIGGARSIQLSLKLVF